VAEENNIGVSRLLGTNGLQQAVDALSSKMGRLDLGIEKLAGGISQLIGSNNRMSGSSSTTGYSWNANSNRNQYSANGGGARFSGGSMGGGRANGGGGFFGNYGKGSRLSATVGAGLAIGSALTNYANQNMAGMMQQNYYGNMAQLGVAGPYSQAAVNTASRQVLSNNYGALSMQDALQSASIMQYAAGNPLNANGSMSAAYNASFSQMQGFAYANPTLGAAAAANAFQQTHSGRSMLMATALLGVGPNASMGQLSQAMMRRSLLPGQKYTAQNIGAALSQTGGLNVNMQSWAAQMGWSGTTVAEMQQYMRDSVKAQSNGIGSTQFDRLMSQAGGGAGITRQQAYAAQNTLRKAGIGASDFELQRNLNSSRMTRQEDINESMSTAFAESTKAVNKLTDTLNSLMKNLGVDRALGLASGGVAPFANALGGFSGAFGAFGGIMAASRAFGGGGGGFGLFSQMFGKGAASSTASNLGAQGANGVYNITTLGADAATAGTAAGAGVAGGAALGALTLAPSLVAFFGQNSGPTTNKVNISRRMGQWVRMHRGATNQQKAIEWSMITGKPASDYYSTQGIKLDAASGTFNPNYIYSAGGTPANPTISGQAPGTGRSGGGVSSVVGGSANNGASNMGANDAEIINFAKKQLGVPYGWGMESPGKAFDCSGLTQWAYGQAGVTIPRVASDQQRTGTAVNVNNTQPGDLLFVGNPAHHVVMNAGGGSIIEAPHSGAKVRLRALNPSEFTSATRIVGNVGNLGLSSNPQSPTTLTQGAGNSGGDIGGYGGTSELAAIMGALSGSIGAGPVGLTSTSNSATSGSSGTGTGNGSAGNGNGKNDISSLQTYAKSLLGQYGWSGEWDSFNKIVMSESGWNVSATNPSSGAYGIPQSLPGNKMAKAGNDWRTNGDTQLRWMMDYIKGRYGDPNAAWSYHQSHNSYAVGAWSIDKDQKANVHAGEMIIPAKQAETIRQTLMNNMFSPTSGNRTSGATISIGQINVQLPVGYSGTASEAQSTGKMIVDAMNEQLRIRNLQVGV
jgi:cell wall-associated NlpC family hydrolase